MRTHKQQGMTLIELMTALAIGAFLMLGAITVFMQSRTTFRINESVARMQENARFAIETLEPEIRMAEYWGLTSTTTNVINRARPTDTAFGGVTTSCGNNFVVNFDQPVAGSNNSYGFGCAGTATVETNADTLVVRRAGEDVETGALAGANTVRIQSVRGAAPARIFVGTTRPAGYDDTTSETHRLFVNAFYVSRRSSLGTGVPSLRVHTLLADGTFQNQEVIAGVEDFQVQFGVDTDVPGTPDRGSIDRFVNTNDAMIDPTNAGFNPNAKILAVRIWLRVRAERAENGFTDTATYTYADRSVGPFNDSFRRIVVSKTIYIRNSRPAS